MTQKLTLRLCVLNSGPRFAVDMTVAPIVHLWQAVCYGVPFWYAAAPHKVQLGRDLDAQLGLLLAGATIRGWWDFVAAATSQSSAAPRADIPTIPAQHLHAAFAEFSRELCSPERNLAANVLRQLFL